MLSEEFEHILDKKEKSLNKRFSTHGLQELIELYRVIIYLL